MKHRATQHTADHHAPEGTPTPMNETQTQTYLDFPGAQELQAAGRVAPAPQQALDRAMAAVIAAAAKETADATARQASGPQPGADRPVVVPIRLRRLLSGRRIAAMLAMAAVAAGVVVAANTTTAAPGPRTRAQQAQADPTVFLAGVAEVAATRSATTAPYWKMELRNVTGGHVTKVTEYVSRSAYLFESKGKLYKKGSPVVWGVGTKTVDWNGLDRLPTDPSTLLSMMNAGQATRGQGVFDQAGNILGGSPATPKLRATLFNALGQLKGVRIAGWVKDSTGRSGTEMVYADSNSTHALIIDPKTSLVLESVAQQAGTTSRTTFLSAGPATTLG
ncbi:hypothetical protein ACWEO4_39380 [Streptomyces sp. NPDC004393]|uniref:hypothetical protein n=1 Tax=Streptomyces sp. NPDC002573 TaxID=3364651 RepID=UPI00368FE56A